MIAGMDHPHIVRVTDVFEENGTAYYVMENLPGGSLADRIMTGGPLSEAQAEFGELLSKCTWTWTSQGGKNGYKVTGKNGNSIFLPASGWRDATFVYFSEFTGPCGDYW